VLSTYIDGNLVKSCNYGSGIDKLKMIHVTFKGTGSVDWVKLYDGSGTLKMSEEFNTDHTSTVQ
jgi:hypothetical protein